MSAGTRLAETVLKVGVYHIEIEEVDYFLYFYGLSFYNKR
jgi:hypothetical protein